MPSLETMEPDDTPLPIDHRSRIKVEGDKLLADIKTFNLMDGVEEEFVYDIPAVLKKKTEDFESFVGALHKVSALRPSELNVVCGILRKSQQAAEERRFMEFSDWLRAKEGWARAAMLWRRHSFGSAGMLFMVGLTTGFGTSVRRWLVSILIVITGFAFLAHNHLDYGSKAANARNAVYWSVVTMSTVGYGDVAPKDDITGEVLASAEAVTGLVMFIGLGMVIGEKIRRS